MSAPLPPTQPASIGSRSSSAVPFPPSSPGAEEEDMSGECDCPSRGLDGVPFDYCSRCFQIVVPDTNHDSECAVLQEHERDIQSPCPFPGCNWEFPGVTFAEGDEIAKQLLTALDEHFAHAHGVADLASGSEKQGSGADRERNSENLQPPQPSSTNSLVQVVDSSSGNGSEGSQGQRLVLKIQLGSAALAKVDSKRKQALESAGASPLENSEEEEKEQSLMVTFNLPPTKLQAFQEQALESAGAGQTELLRSLENAEEEEKKKQLMVTLNLPSTKLQAVQERALESAGASQTELLRSLENTEEEEKKKQLMVTLKLTPGKLQTVQDERRSKIVPFKIRPSQLRKIREAWNEQPKLLVTLKISPLALQVIREMFPGEENSHFDQVALTTEATLESLGLPVDGRHGEKPGKQWTCMLCTYSKKKNDRDWAFKADTEKKVKDHCIQIHGLEKGTDFCKKCSDDGRMRVWGSRKAGRRTDHDTRTHADKAVGLAPTCCYCFKPFPGAVGHLSNVRKHIQNSCPANPTSKRSIARKASDYQSTPELSKN
ncbi:hypothetical protein BJ508DRAFT_347229 [Ascobolus immersus RN42]|uniref:Uncharacterized protein n=1 Tax=Ascobolus immersus RN42 TaxID=1160509 RepID=A0A3N4I2E4_ASCIM|nr:hypothetical protein BJ508DRAFT_347229 [Ascobolus immersus RN42]